MAVNVEDLDFDDEELEGQENYEQELEQEKPWINSENLEPTENPEENPELLEQPESEEEDLITYMLRAKGIKDPEKIKFENEDGNLEEIPFSSLTREEQLNILKPEDKESNDTDLDDLEIELINKIRSNKLTPAEYENYLILLGMEKALQDINQPRYQIDDIEDDELFVLDLQARFETITDEEAVEALNKAKSDESLYKKQIEGIRDEYKRMEDDKNKREQFEQEEAKKEQLAKFSNQIQDSILNFNNIGKLDVDLDQDDKEDIALFLLGTDGAGINYFSKALNDPNTLVRMAWFALKGEDAFNSVADYFTNEIKQREQASYQKGLNEAKKGNNPSVNKVVYQPKQNINNTQNRKLLTIYDLD